ncbi:MAG: hypothetical protein ACYTHM_20560, partial [Planctomycetota bacterium]
GTADQKAYIAAFRAHNEGRMDEAEKGARALTAKLTSEPRYPILLAHILLHQTPPKADLAGASYEAGLDLDAKAKKGEGLPRRFWSNAVEGLGIAYLIIGNMAKARDTFNHGVNRDLDHGGHFFYLAVLETQDKKKKKKRDSLFMNLRKMCNRDRGKKWRRIVVKDKIFDPFRKHKLYKPAMGP